MTELKKLQTENTQLKEQLLVAEAWMKRQIKENIRKITQEKINEKNKESDFCSFDNKLEEQIESKIYAFFGEILLLNIPSSVIENIVSSEINYIHFKRTPSFDGLSVISSYHKALDALIDSFIIKDFRKFCRKHKQTTLEKNDPLEKSLHSVVNKNYILSVGRLYHLLKNIKNNGELFAYGQKFKQYLELRSFLTDVLYGDNFFTNLSSLIKSEVFGKKRHIGRITFVETRRTRGLIIGDFENNNCLIHQLIQTQNLDF